MDEGAIVGDRDGAKEQGLSEGSAIARDEAEDSQYAPAVIGSVHELQDVEQKLTWKSSGRCQSSADGRSAPLQEG